jgi:ectoine hydroxylase-related dioxygenase (phytanoyl-CoA dioxygenase family)
MLIFKKAFFLPLFTQFLLLSLNADDFIKPPNGKQYKIEMINPTVYEQSDLLNINRFFKENGYVVVKDVSSEENRKKLVGLIDQIMEKNIPQCRRLGFLDLYHDDTLAQLRQDPRVYKVFANILGSDKLWVVFDRVIFQKKTEGEDPLPPHVDQNPIENPDFFNVQAMLALKDMNESTGTLAVVPKSPLFFHEYKQWTKPGDGYVEYQKDDLPPFVGLRLKEGEIVIWDSRTTHSRFRGNPEADRYAALITFTLAKEDPQLYDLRQKYFTEGIGWNSHEAGLRATSRPRCEQSLRHQKENLTPLGRKLYGLDKWN